MAATTGIINATLIKISIDGSTIDNLISNNDDLSMDARDITTKDSSGNQDLGPGKKSGTLAFESVFEEGATTNYSTLYAAYDNRTLVAWIHSSGVVDDKQYSGNGYITALSKGGSVEDNYSYSGTISITGGTAEATIT